MLFLNRITSLLLCVNTVFAGDLVIKPIDPVIFPGSDLNITCTCTSPDCKSSDIVWKRHYRTPVKEGVTSVDKKTSQYRKQNVTLEEFRNSPVYSCCLGDPQNDCFKPATTVTVATPPGPVKNLYCASRNIVDYWCEWEAGESTNLKVNYVLKYSDNITWRDCPDYITKGKNTCYIRENDNNGSSQQIKLISTNALGNHTDYTRFDPNYETIPNPPNIVSVKGGNQNVMVNWTIPKEWKKERMYSLEYKIRYKASASETWQEVTHIQHALSWNLNGLDAFNRYDVEMAGKIQYINKSRYWSTWSDTRNAMTAEKAPTGRVQDFAIAGEESISNYKRNVNLEWGFVRQGERHGNITHYVLHVYKRKESAYSGSWYNETRLMFTLSGIDKYATYAVTIRAVNSAGDGPEAMIEIQDDTSKPNAPTFVRGFPSSNSNSTIQVKWKPAAERNGYLRNYTIEWRITDAENWSKFDTLSENVTDYEITGLLAYTLYNIRIRANNDKYNGIWTDIRSTRTKDGVPTGAPDGVVVKEDTKHWDKLQVTWNPLEEIEKKGDIQKYQIRYCRLMEESTDHCIGNYSIKDIPGVSSVSGTVDGLQSFTAYLVWVVAYTSAGPGPASQKIAANTSQGIPTAPMNLTITNTTSTTISLSWDTPQELHGILQHYTVEYFSLASDQNQNPESIEVNGLNAVVSGLLGYETYIFRVSAQNALHLGRFSEDAWDTTKIGAPGSPVQFSASPVSSKGMSLSWDFPLHFNGPKPYFIVEYRRSSNEEWQKKKVTTTNTTVSVECDLIEKGVMFDFRVSAVNVDEKGQMLQGESTEPLQYQMCRPVPVYVVVPAVVISLSVIGAVIFIACFVKHIKKTSVFQEVPEPHFIQDTRMDIEWNGTFHTPETEVFDELCENVPELFSSRPDNELPTAADFFLCDSTPTQIQQYQPQTVTKTPSHINPIAPVAAFNRSESTDSGFPDTPSSAKEFFPMLTLAEDDDVFESHLLSSENNKMKDNPMAIDIHSLFNPNHMGSSVSVSSHMKLAQNPGDKLPILQRKTQVETTAKTSPTLGHTPRSSLSVGDDPYFKMSRLPTQQEKHPNTMRPHHGSITIDPVSEQPLMPNSILNTQSILTTSDNYAKMSQIPHLATMPNTNQTDRKQVEIIPQVQSLPFEGASTKRVEFDPNSKMSQLPTFHLSEHEQQQQIKENTPNILELSKSADKTEINRNTPPPVSHALSHIPSLQCERVGNPSSFNKTVRKSNSDPYSKMSALPHFMTAKPKVKQNYQSMYQDSRPPCGTGTFPQNSPNPNTSEQIPDTHLGQARHIALKHASGGVNNPPVGNLSHQSIRKPDSDPYSKMSQLSNLVTVEQQVKHIDRSISHGLRSPIGTASDAQRSQTPKASQNVPMMHLNEERNVSSENVPRAGSRPLQNTIMKKPTPNPYSKVSQLPNFLTAPQVKHDGQSISQNSRSSIETGTYVESSQMRNVSEDVAITRSSDNISLAGNPPSQNLRKPDSDPYSKMSQLPNFLTAAQQRNPSPQNTRIRQSNSDPYAKMSQLPNFLRAKKDETEHEKDTSQSSKTPLETKTQAKIISDPSGSPSLAVNQWQDIVTCPGVQKPSLPLPLPSSNPYSKISELPNFQKRNQPVKSKCAADHFNSVSETSIPDPSKATSDRHNDIQSTANDRTLSDFGGIQIQQYTPSCSVPREDSSLNYTQSHPGSMKCQALSSISNKAVAPYVKFSELPLLSTNNSKGQENNENSICFEKAMGSSELSENGTQSKQGNKVPSGSSYTVTNQLTMGSNHSDFSNPYLKLAQLSTHQH